VGCLKQFYANLFSTVLAPVHIVDESLAVDPVEQFKVQTLRKLEGLTCHTHGKAPEVIFHGHTLRDMRISMRCCCRELSALANRAIARTSAIG